MTVTHTVTAAPSENDVRQHAEHVISALERAAAGGSPVRMDTARAYNHMVQLLPTAQSLGALYHLEIAKGLLYLYTVRIQQQGFRMASKDTHQAIQEAVAAAAEEQAHHVLAALEQVYLSPPEQLHLCLHRTLLIAEANINTDLVTKVPYSPTSAPVGHILGPTVFPNQRPRIGNIPFVFVSSFAVWMCQRLCSLSTCH